MTAPTITTQPLSQRLKIGDTLNLSVVATGTAPLHYQWFRGADEVGFDNSSYSVSPFDYSDEGTYTVIVTNNDGSITSDEAVIKSGPSQLDEEYLQRKLFTWISSIIDIWDGTGTRGANQIAMVWHMQDVQRYPTPVLMGRISAVQRVGRDCWFNPNSDLKRRLAGIREFMFYLQFFGAGAIGQLEKIVDATDSPSEIADLQGDGITPVECEQIIDAHVFLDTMPEERAILDIRFRTTTEWLKQIDVVETAEIIGKVNGSDTVIIENN
jgi:hypothetical protein